MTDISTVCDSVECYTLASLSCRFALPITFNPQLQPCWHTYEPTTWLFILLSPYADSGPKFYSTSNPNKTTSILLVMYL